MAEVSTPVEPLAAGDVGDAGAPPVVGGAQGSHTGGRTTLAPLSAATSASGAGADAGAGAGVGAGAGPPGGAHSGGLMPSHDPSSAHDDDDVHEEVKLNMPMISEHVDEDVVKLHNVHKTYLLGIEGVPALRGVSLTIKKGEFVVILGKSGSGKTTMLNVIGTIDVPTRGELYLCGRRITSKTTDYDLAHTRLVQLGFVFQTFNLLPSMTASENVEMPMVLAGVPSAERKRRARELLNRVGMGHRFDHVPAQLSGGEQQRVTIARALSNRPQVLLLDEPTGDLDTVNSNIVMRLITDLNVNEKTTMVMVTHDVGLRAFAHRVVHMLDGKVQRIEIVPPSVRKRALEDLRAATKNTTAVGHLGVDPESATGKPAAASSVADAAKYTSVRKPSFYSRLIATSV